MSLLGFFLFFFLSGKYFQIWVMLCGSCNKFQIVKPSVIHMAQMRIQNPVKLEQNIY